MFRIENGFIFFLILLILMAFGVRSAFGQENLDVGITPKVSTKLIDLYELTTAEERSARFDAFMTEIQNSPNSTGYIFIYCGKRCKYGEVEAHIRGIEQNFVFRKFPRDRFVILNAGFKKTQTTELWLVPERACPPKPITTLTIRDVVFNGTYKKGIVAYNCCE